MVRMNTVCTMPLSVQALNLAGSGAASCPVLASQVQDVVAGIGVEVGGQQSQDLVGRPTRVGCRDGAVFVGEQFREREAAGSGKDDLERYRVPPFRCRLE